MKLDNKSGIFERISQFSEFKGFKNLNEFSNYIGYVSPEKLYRLGRNVKNKPSYDMLVQISDKFEDLNLNWLIKGTGDMIIEDDVLEEEPVVNPVADSITSLLQAVSDANDTTLRDNIELLKHQLHRIAENENEMKTKIDHIYQALLKVELSEGIQKTIDKVQD